MVYPQGWQICQGGITVDYDRFSHALWGEDKPKHNCGNCGNYDWDCQYCKELEIEIPLHETDSGSCEEWREKDD